MRVASFTAVSASVVRSGGGKSSVYVIFLFIVFSKENKGTVWNYCLSLVMVCLNYAECICSMLKNPTVFIIDYAVELSILIGQTVINFP